MCSNSTSNELLTTAAVEGHLHLQRLLLAGALYTQHNDIDATFVRQFVDIYMQKDLIGLATLQQLFQEYSDSLPSSAAGDAIRSEQHHLVKDILLSFYIGLLLRIVQSSNLAIFQSTDVRQFLRQHQSRFFYNTDSATHPPLFQLTYDLMHELHKLQVPLEQWPFQLDLHQLIIAPLKNECTSIAFRQAVEQFAIAQIRRPERHEFPHRENISSEREFASNELVSIVVQVLLNADFSIVLESCARILCACQHIANILPRILNERVVQKAKRTRRIGHAFSELTAKLLLFHPNFELSIAEGFSDRFTHILVLTKLADLVNLVETTKNDKKERQRHVLDLLAIISQHDLNYIGPLLMTYKEIMETQEFNKFLLSLLRDCKWRNCSNDALNTFVHCLLLVDPEMSFVLPDAIDIILPHLLTSTFAILLLQNITSQARGDHPFKRYPTLCEKIRELISPFFINDENCKPSASVTAVVKAEKDCDNVVCDGSDWEYMDSVLRILNILGPYHGLDNTKLFDCLLAIALQRHKCNRNNNQFLCQPSVRLLCELFSSEQLCSICTEIFRANAEDEEIRFMLLSNALSLVQRINNNNKNIVPNCELLSNVVNLLAQLGPDEEESSPVLRTAIQLCERIIEIEDCNGLTVKDFERVASICALLKSQLDVVEWRHRKKNHEYKDMRGQMEELIREFDSHGCYIDGGTAGMATTAAAVDRCGSKDCY